MVEQNNKKQGKTLTWRELQWKYENCQYNYPLKEKYVYLGTMIAALQSENWE